MSFRLFVYYCALVGGWAAFAGWALGRNLAPLGELAQAGVKGFCLGLTVALGIGFVDALWDVSIYRFVQVTMRVLSAVLVGSIGGLLGGVIGQLLFGLTEMSAFLVLGWAITGMLVGVSIGSFEAVTRLLANDNPRGAVRKVLNGVLGGTLGGALGGGITLALRGVWGGVFQGKPVDELWSPSATGFVALGLCIGLLIGVARVILKEAWIKVEQGRRAGRQQILSKSEITIGRAENCDIGLFGDRAIERVHARILLQNNRYVLVDAGSASGTFVNGAPVAGPTPLSSGDLIRVGGSVLRFGESQKRSPS